MSTPSVEVYRNLTRRAWSVRVGGRVVGHVPAIALRDVALRASEASRLRCVRLGIRDVHAFARGVPSTDSRPPTAVRFRYRLDTPGFRLTDGQAVSVAAAAWFEADGSAWCLACAGANVTRTEGPMRLRDLTPDEIATVDARRARVREALGDAADAAPFLDAWEPVTYPGTDRISLRGLCWGHPVHGDTVVTTSVLVARGPGWAATESGRVYVLGDRHAPPSAISYGRRGAGRLAPLPPSLSRDEDADLPALEI